MRDQRHPRLVADDHRGGDERQAGVLHAAVGERRRQHQHVVALPAVRAVQLLRSEEHKSELQSLMRISYAGFCLTKKTATTTTDRPDTPEPRSPTRTQCTI